MNWFGVKNKETEKVSMPQKVFLTHDQMKANLNKIIKQINADDWRPDYIVGIVRGGLYPAVMLSHYLDVPMHALKVTLRDGVEDDCDTNCWMAEDAYGYPSSETDKCNILIVDDINDSGATIKWIKNNWQGSCLPDSPEWNNVWHNNVKFATVVNNLSSSEDVDYWGIEINKAENNLWFSFPYEEWWEK